MSWQLYIIRTVVPPNHFTSFFSPSPYLSVQWGAEHAAGRPRDREGGAGAVLVEGRGGAGRPRGGAWASPELACDRAGERCEDGRSPAEPAQREGEDSIISPD